MGILLDKVNKGLKQRFQFTMRQALPGSYSDNDWAYLQKGSVTTYVTAIVKFKKGYFDSSFTTGNALESGWEAVPFSFVIDYFGNIGNILSSLDSLDGVDSVVGSASTRVEADIEAVPKILGNWEMIEPYKCNFKSHQRIAFNQFDLELIPHITWEPSLSWKRIMNFAALINLLRS
jgi:hypothetical protein